MIYLTSLLLFISHKESRSDNKVVRALVALPALLQCNTRYILPFHMTNFKPVSKLVSNRFNSGVFAWPLGVAVNYVTPFMFAYRLGVN